MSETNGWGLFILTLQNEETLNKKSQSIVDSADTRSADEVVGKISPEKMTSKDYYFDSYAHFGIHEVIKYSI